MGDSYYSRAGSSRDSYSKDCRDRKYDQYSRGSDNEKKRYQPHRSRSNSSSSSEEVSF